MEGGDPVEEALLGVRVEIVVEVDQRQDYPEADFAREDQKGVQFLFKGREPVEDQEVN